MRNRIDSIPYRKGTTAWLSKFVSALWCNPCREALNYYNLSAEQLFQLNFIAREFRLNKKNWAATNDLFIANFLLRNEFDVSWEIDREGMYYIIEAERSKRNGKEVCRAD